MSKSLFRQEAIDHQREKFFGETTSVQPLSFWVLTGLGVGAALLMIAVAVWGQYTRRERVDGFLEADLGTARVTAPDAGRIVELMIQEGQEVKAGAPMARISYERSTSSATSTNAAVAGELNQRKGLLEKEQGQVKELGEQQVLQVRKRIRDLEAEIAQQENEVKLQERRVASAKEQAQRYAELAKDKFYSEIAVKQKQDEVTDQEIRLQQQKRNRLNLERDLAAAKLDETAAGLRARTQSDQVARQISEVQQNMVQEEAKRETVIRAPIDGTATNIAVTVGQSVAADASLATVLPKGGVLHAEMLVPTRAIGFVGKGREVVLRYEAFPYERFGLYHGVISEVSQAVWSPGEKVGPLAVREPAYRVKVTLDKQSVAAQGQEVPLRSGMLVNADILLEKRSLLEWIFEPVLQLKGRL